MNAMDKIEKASPQQRGVTGIATGFIDLDYRTAECSRRTLLISCQAFHG